MIIDIELENLGTANRNRVTIWTDKGKFYLFFSYQTVVGVEYYWDNSHYKYCIQNQWSTTTGKLLNEIEPDKKARLTPDEFKAKVNEAMSFISK